MEHLPFILLCELFLLALNLVAQLEGRKMRQENPSGLFLNSAQLTASFGLARSQRAWRTIWDSWVPGALIPSPCGHLG